MKKAIVNKNLCVACGCCTNVCKVGAVSIFKGVCAIVNTEKCVGCGRCAKECPASIIKVREVDIHE